MQLLETTALGAAPGRLRELLARLQRPGFLDLQALRGSQLVAGIDAGKGRARIDLDHHFARCFFLGGIGQLHGHRGAEIAQGAYQLAYVGIGRAQQARQLAALQIGLVAKTLEFKMLLQQRTDLFWGIDFQREGGGTTGVDAHGFGFFVFGGKQAAAAEEQGGSQKQSRPQGRLFQGQGLGHAPILTACAWRLPSL